VKLLIDLTDRTFLDDLPANGGMVIESLDLKRRDAEPVEVQFLTAGIVTDLGSGATGILGLKRSGAYASGYIASALSWVKTGSGTSAKYTFALTLNTAEIDALFTSASEGSSLRAMLEVQWTVGSVITSSVTLPSVIANDVIRGDEGALAQANPDYPAAADVLTKSGNLAGLGSVPTARGNLSVYSQAETDGLLGGKPNIATTAPADLGATAAVGSSATAARADHVHRIPTLSELGAVSTTDARLSDARPPLAHDAALITSGTISLDRLPSLSTGVQVVSSGTIADLTAPQQAQIITGAIVTTIDGRRWLYKGTGSKVVESSYIEMGDITPEWTAIANRPSTFTPSAHTHPQSEVTNLVSDLASKADAAATTSALAGKAASVHTHAQSDVTGLVSDLANKRTILSGTSVPSAGLGSDGDLYIDTLGNRLYGPKTAGSWGSGSFTKGDPGSGATAVISSANFTASTGVRYITTTTLTVTDPVGTAVGQNYEVLVGAGTCTIGGVAFAPSRIEIIRYFNGTSWQTQSPVFTDNLTLNGTANAAANQNAISLSSILTRREMCYTLPWANPIILPTLTLSANGTGASTSSNVTAQCAAGLTLSTAATSSSYASGSIANLWGGLLTGQGMALTGEGWTLSFVVESNFSATASPNLQYGVILGTSSAATSLVPNSAQRNISFYVTGAGVGYLARSNGSTVTTSSALSTPTTGFVRYVLTWSGIVTNTLTLYAVSGGVGTTSLASTVSTLGSLTGSLGANTLSGPTITFLSQGTGNQSVGYTAALGIGQVQFLYWPCHN
jgi:hypothetical protein